MQDAHVNDAYIVLDEHSLDLVLAATDVAVAVLAAVGYPQPRPNRMKIKAVLANA